MAVLRWGTGEPWMGAALVSELVSTPTVHLPFWKYHGAFDQSTLLLEKVESWWPGSSSVPISHVTAESR